MGGEAARFDVAFGQPREQQEPEDQRAAREPHRGEARRIDRLRTQRRPAQPGVPGEGDQRAAGQDSRAKGARRSTPLISRAQNARNRSRASGGIGRELADDAISLLAHLENAEEAIGRCDSGPELGVAARVVGLHVRRLANRNRTRVHRGILRSGPVGGETSSDAIEPGFRPPDRPLRPTREAPSSSRDIVRAHPAFRSRTRERPRGVSNV